MRRAAFMSFMLIALAASAAAAPQVIHEPVAAAELGQPVPVTLSLSELGHGTPLVTLFYRGLSQEGFESAVMRESGAGSFMAVIPARVTHDLGLEYYMQVSEEGETSLALGSRAHPFRVNLMAPPRAAGSTQVLMFWGSLSAVVLLVGLWIRASQKGRRARLQEQLFWLRVLAPLASCTSAEISKEITRLSGTPLNHPRKGLTVFSRQVILRKIRMVSEMDVAAFLDECDRYLEPGFERPNIRRPEPPPHKTDVKTSSSARLKAV